jgi:hypothetical protein
MKDEAEIKKSKAEQELQNLTTDRKNMGMGGMSAIEKRTKKELNFKNKEAEKYKDDWMSSNSGAAKKMKTSGMQNAEVLA